MYDHSFVSLWERAFLKCLQYSRSVVLVLLSEEQSESEGGCLVLEFISERGYAAVHFHLGIFPQEALCSKSFDCGQTLQVSSLSGAISSASRRLKHLFTIRVGNVTRTSRSDGALE